MLNDWRYCLIYTWLTHYNVHFTHSLSENKSFTYYSLQNQWNSFLLIWNVWGSNVSQVGHDGATVSFCLLFHCNRVEGQLVLQSKTSAQQATEHIRSTHRTFSTKWHWLQTETWWTTLVSNKNNKGSSSNYWNKC